MKNGPGVLLYDNILCELVPIKTTPDPISVRQKGTQLDWCFRCFPYFSPYAPARSAFLSALSIFSMVRKAGETRPCSMRFSDSGRNAGAPRQVRLRQAQTPALPDDAGGDGDLQVFQGRASTAHGNKPSCSQLRRAST